MNFISACDLYGVAKSRNGLVCLKAESKLSSNLGLRLAPHCEAILNWSGVLSFPAELSQAINSGTLLSKPSPPLPPKRGIPSTLVPTSESPATTATTKAPSDQREKSTCSVGSEPLSMIPPPSPSPPLPTHIPPEPPRSPPFPAKTFQVVPEAEFPPSLDLPHEVSQQEAQKKEVPKRMLDHSFGEPHVPSRLPPLPLHIRIQQALTSPLPATPPLEGSHRAHSLLFEYGDSFSEDSSTLGRTRSLPITIEMLKVWVPFKLAFYFLFFTLGSPSWEKLLMKRKCEQI